MADSAPPPPPQPPEPPRPPAPQTPPPQAVPSASAPAPSVSLPLPPPLPPRPPALAVPPPVAENKKEEPAPVPPKSGEKKPEGTVVPPELPPLPGPIRRAPGDKRAQPLLSRSREKRQKAPRELAGTDSGAGAPPLPRPPRKTPIGLQIFFRVLAYGAIVGLGIGGVRLFRQTQVQGLIDARGFKLPTEAYVVRDFSDDVRTLHSEFQSANGPFEKDLRTKLEALSRAKADLAAIDQRKKLIGDDIMRSEGEIGTIVRGSQEEAQRVWQRDGAALDAQYAGKLDELRQRLADRAKGLNLAPDLDPAAKSPEVWVNAFRLALYNPPPAVKAVQEREWIEKQLVDWHEYEKTFDASQQDLKVRTDAIRSGVGPKIEMIHDHLDKIHDDLKEADATAEPIHSEIETLQSEADAAQARATAQRVTYTSQLAEIPKRTILEKLPVDARGRFEWPHLEQNPKYPPDSYLLWAVIRKDDQDYWALVPFTVREYRRLDLVLRQGAFVPALDLLLK